MGGLGPRAAAACLSAAIAVGGCAQEPYLTGERFPIRAPLSASEGTESVDGDGEVDRPAENSDVRTEVAVEGDIVPVGLPEPVDHKEWTHRNGSIAHRIAHPALGPDPALAFSVDIGRGNNRRHRITADPVVADGRVFAIDAYSTVTAHTTEGAPLWSRAMHPAHESSGDASGGGLAHAEGTLFATTGFGAVIAFDAATGETRWRHELGALTTGPPAVADGLIYVVSRDGRGWALDSVTGRVNWSLPGTAAAAVRRGGAGPILTDRLVIFPFGTGEMIGALRRSGIRVWSASVQGERRGRAYASVGDITGDPVLVGDTVYAANHSGGIVAIDADDGTRIWTAGEGAVNPVWPVGDSLFLVNDQSELARLDARTGERIWSRPLPWFRNTRAARRRGIHAHYGPTLAGGRLWVASDDGRLRVFDPETGEAAEALELPGGAASSPVVVDGTMYVLSRRGRLLAYR